MAEGFESAIGESADVGGKADAEQVEGVDGAGRVAEAKNIHAPFSAGEKCFDGRFRALVGEIAQEGIAGAQGEKAELNAVGLPFAREDAVYNFVRGAVAAGGEKTAIALVVGFAG